MPVQKIMVVDDDPPQLTNLMKIVQGAGYITVTANSGEAAVETAKKEHPDLILMDIIMKQMDGFGATRELRKDPATKDIPVVFVSSKNQQADKVWAKMVGGNGYVPKPYTEDEILAQIRSFA
jgi:twitching motility two-component system response regulator PilH